MSDFGQALKWMKAEKYVYRKETPEDVYHWNLVEGYFERNGRVCSFTCEELFALDWCRLPEQPKPPELFDFIEAFEKMKQGARVRRQDWKAKRYLSVGAEGLDLCSLDTSALWEDDLTAKDWCVLQPPKKKEGL